MKEKSHYRRMMEIIEETFDTRNDPEQLQVDDKVIKRLQRMHPATLSEYNDGRGPAAWILMIPTTEKVMRDFIQGKISESQLLDETPTDAKYESIYLCSATVLPEYRKKGLATSLSVKAIREIQQEYPIRSLFVWPFTEEGERVAERVAEETGLALFRKKNA